MINTNHKKAITYIKALLEQDIIEDALTAGMGEEIVSEYEESHPPKVDLEDQPVFTGLNMFNSALKKHFGV